METEEAKKRQKIEITAADDDSSGAAGRNEKEEEEEWTQVPGKRHVFFPVDEEGEAKLVRFYKQIKESEGFDFDEFPPVDVVQYGVTPVNLNSSSPWRKDVDDCINHVINEHNERDNGVLKLVAGEVLKANKNTCNGNNFFITFKATNLLAIDPNDAAEKVYHAQVYRDRFDNCQTLLLREKGQKEVIFESPDRPILLTYPSSSDDEDDSEIIDKERSI